MTSYETEQIKMLSNLFTLSTLMKSAMATGKADKQQLRQACSTFLSNQYDIIKHVKQLESALDRDLTN